MSQETLDRLKSVVVLNAQAVALELSLLFKNEPIAKQRSCFAGSADAGYFYLYANDKHPDTLFECVMSHEGGDAITSTYKGHPIFNSPGELVSARESAINAIAERAGLSVPAVGIEDPARGRSIGLVELSTGQLIDLLAEQFGGKVIMVTESHSAAGAAR